MSGLKVVGLLDRPSPRSLGMLGVIIEREDGGKSIHGVVGIPASRPVDDHEIQQLMEGGDARPVAGSVLHDDGRSYAALWVGTEFEKAATRLKVPLPPLSKTAFGVDDTGTCWIGSTQHVWRVLDSWVTRAFRRSVQGTNQELATLMAWAMPGRQETRAAIWHTDPARRKANLDWWVRLDRGQGDAKVVPGDLEKRYERMAGEVRAHPPRRVFGLCARAKGGDNEIAKELSNKLEVQRVGFGAWLKKKAEEKAGKSGRRALQDLGQRMIDEVGALAFCLDVLEDLHRTTPIPTSPFVIDGIRHEAVRRSLLSLIGEDHFTLVYIDRPEEERRQLLIEQEHIALNEVEAVMNHPTELDIDNVVRHADMKYSWKTGVKAIAGELACIL